MIHLVVYGIAQPQGSKSAIVNKKTGRAVMVEGKDDPSRERKRAWRDAVADAGRRWQEENQQPLLDEPLWLRVTVVLPRPKSRPKKDRWPDRKPDLSKLLRSIEDSLTGILIRDDARFVTIEISKVYAEPDEAPYVKIVIDRMTSQAR